jgi:hypothetical protein
MEATATLNRHQRRQAMKNSRYSHNNRKNNQRTIQIIWSEPRKIMIGSYTTKSGQVKNRYRINPSAKVIKIITHKIFQINY